MIGNIFYAAQEKSRFIWGFGDDWGLNFNVCISFYLPFVLGCYQIIESQHKGLIQGGLCPLSPILFALASTSLACLWLINEKPERIRVHKGRYVWSSLPKCLVINMVPSVLCLADPGRVLPSLHLCFQWTGFLLKNWQITKLKASIRVGVKITEIKVAFHPLQRASNI